MTSVMWFFTVVVGPILLLSAIVWAVLRSRKITPRQDARTEAATRQLREDIAHDPQYRDG